MAGTWAEEHESAEEEQMTGRQDLLARSDSKSTRQSRGDDLRSLVVDPSMSTGLADWQPRTAKVAAYRANLPTTRPLLPFPHAAPYYSHQAAVKGFEEVSIGRSETRGFVGVVVNLVVCSWCFACNVIQMTREACEYPERVVVANVVCAKRRRIQQEPLQRQFLHHNQLYRWKYSRINSQLEQILQNSWSLSPGRGPKRCWCETEGSSNAESSGRRSEGATMVDSVAERDIGGPITSLVVV